MKEFECERCGYCCTHISTQINMSLLDIKWLSDYTKKSVKRLFDEGMVSFVPFIRAEDLSTFDVELGLKRPCPMYKDKKCVVYHARPMNCRTFPYWLINHKIPDSLACIQGVEPAEKYKEYERTVGKILLDEGLKTERFMKKIGAYQRIDLSDEKKYLDLKKDFEKTNNRDEMEKLSDKMIKLAEKKIDKKLFEKIPLIQKEVEKRSFDVEIDKLIQAEELVQ
ncbi:YkgJ family cysteine cluster protein [Candidatus Woesearchaeota archaeon]|nr:YkgJ family cysteine cluster protein [Candidatus Woesearchaeota archaeon]